MKTRLTLFSIIAVLFLTSCTSKVATTPFTAPTKANDDIATTVKIGLTAEENLEKQKLITAHEGLFIINGLSAVNAANVQLNADLTAAKASGNKSALRPSLDALKKAVNDLNTNGVLGLKSPEARQAFALAIQTFNLALATLESFTSSP